MAGSIQHSYRYPFQSGLRTRSNAVELNLATSGGVAEFPYFFQGSLKQPRLTAQLFRALAKVVASRFHIPPAMLKRIVAERDPVVTSGGGMLRLEGFSGCCSVYSRVDIDPDAYDGVVVGQGTTNVDFNAPMRAALAQIRDNERIGIAIGTDEVALLRGSDQIVERKVDLPIRWLKGFSEVQAYQAKMERRIVLGKVDAIRFFRSLPRTTTAKAAYWIVPSSGGLRLSQCASREGIRVAGIERLRILEDLVSYADTLSIAADNGEASEWTLHFGALRFTLAISAEVWRGFSGEGQILADLAGNACTQTMDLVRGLLKWQAELRPEEFAANWDVSVDSIQRSISLLGSRGLVGFDTRAAAYFHRELPFDMALVEDLHPRIKAARKIVESGGVEVLRRTDGSLEIEVQGSGITHRVSLDGERGRCTCPWFAKFQGARGPCKHVLGAMLVAERDGNLLT